MARVINIWKERNVVSCIAYDDDYAHWIYESEYMLAIEKDDRSIVVLPAMDRYFLNGDDADGLLRTAHDEQVRILIRDDCPARNEDVMKNVTEWIINEPFADTAVEAICNVVSLLERNGMWKDKYAAGIDIKKIEEAYETE